LLIAYEATSYGAGEFKQHYNKGIEFYKLGKYDQAGSEFEKALELKPTDVYAIYGLGNTYYCLTKYDDAVKAYSKAIEINPDYEKVHYSLSLAYSKLGMRQEAEKHKTIFKKLSKGEKVSESSGTHASTSQTKRFKGVDYSKQRTLATAPKKSLASAKKKPVPSREAVDTRRTYDESATTHDEVATTHTTHEQSRHDSAHQETVHQEKTVYESHKAPTTSRTKKDDSGSIFKGYSEETHKADKRVFTKKHHRVSGTTKNPFSSIKYYVQDKWYVSGIHRIWICAAGYIFATQMWLCIVSFLCVIVWRIRERA
jgi:TolA-binding protein